MADAKVTLTYKLDGTEKQEHDDGPPRRAGLRYRPPGGTAQATIVTKQEMGAR